MTWQQINRSRGQFYRKWVKIWRAYFEAQEAAIIDNLRNNREPTTNTFNVAEVERLMIDLHSEVGLYFAQKSFVQLKQDAQVITWERIMAEWAALEGAEAIVSITANGRDQVRIMIKALTSRAIEEGWSIDQLTDLIERNVAIEWRKRSIFNAERIARTEVISASNKGAFEGAKSSGLPLIKVWITALDGRERDTHAGLNGRVMDMNQPFVSPSGAKLMVPGDRSAPAAEVINCRCAVDYRVNRSRR